MASILPKPSSLLTTLVYATLLLHVTLGLSCPKPQSPVLDDKVMGSQVVVQGEVKRQVKASSQDSSYTAEMEVLCVFKGGPLALHINITGAGKPADSCVQTDLRRGQVYLVYLNPVKDAPNTFTPTFTQDPAEKKYLDELKYSCGLSVQLPQGVTESDVCHPEKFVSDYELEDCPTSGCPVTFTTAAVTTASFVTCWVLRLLL